MTKVNINKQPQEKGAPAPVAANVPVVVDALGRAIKLKKPAPLANLDFKKALGNNHQNVLYLAEVMPLAYVASIDDEAVPIPVTDKEIRALYQRLGEEGNAAVQAGVAQHFFNETKAVEEEQELKNS